MASSSGLSFADSLTSAERLAFYGHHKFLAVSMILILFFLPFVGLFASQILHVLDMKGAGTGISVQIDGSIGEPNPDEVWAVFILYDP